MYIIIYISMWLLSVDKKSVYSIKSPKSTRHGRYFNDPSRQAMNGTEHCNWAPFGPHFSGSRELMVKP